ncbi:hypothetical protein NIES2135_20610 [Leptolyngbya boryana NIES-2135]|jgi:hypothetical protein|uniref:Uncharacterized protein n=1 Tax=Leptolyngbya boryana NIES-2135 TaxID=1973484 RepID=A0A1Z4JEY6_LEPBY|nr:MULTISPECIES: hypothetical protein [Leptolyngbya]BAY55238.1 hypothetical protein NIES2135_20610 [Leptolyngbya boryana NIES-2135]MBD2369323.1 hypothetical protein [Leptolyngbya sp. FACHB-161]MBD2375675.1 hypothetical protein [Leptolyngbya sp. FACHB-238]MBD2401652.1 hypothetical protein [Leptolyngbya sp. FACHB-239]MBD2406609.1 hypothetical protein [Leptolyngbya sp. FACHB-402]
MLTEQFQIIYRALLEISTHPAFFTEEKQLASTAKQALETADVKQMWQALVKIAMRQGFHDDERKIIDLAQKAIEGLLLQMQMIDEPVKE